MQHEAGRASLRIHVEPYLCVGAGEDVAAIARRELDPSLAGSLDEKPASLAPDRHDGTRWQLITADIRVRRHWCLRTERRRCHA